MRFVGLLLIALILSACSTTTPEPTAAPIIPTIEPTAAPTPSPVAIWKEKLSGRWNDGTSIWLIDIDGGSLGVGFAGTSSETEIEFDREEGKSVFITIKGTAETRTDRFRFIDDNTVIWAAPLGDKTLTRAR